MTSLTSFNQIPQNLNNNHCVKKNNKSPRKGALELKSMVAPHSPLHLTETISNVLLMASYKIYMPLLLFIPVFRLRRVTNDYFNKLDANCTIYTINHLKPSRSKNTKGHVYTKQFHTGPNEWMWWRSSICKYTPLSHWPLEDAVIIFNK